MRLYADNFIGMYIPAGVEILFPVSYPQLEISGAVILSALQVFFDVGTAIQRTDTAVLFYESYGTKLPGRC